MYNPYIHTCTSRFFSFPYTIFIAVKRFRALNLEPLVAVVANSVVKTVARAFHVPVGDVTRTTALNTWNLNTE